MTENQATFQNNMHAPGWQPKSLARVYSQMTIPKPLKSQQTEKTLEAKQGRKRLQGLPTERVTRSALKKRQEAGKPRQTALVDGRWTDADPATGYRVSSRQIPKAKPGTSYPPEAGPSIYKGPQSCRQQVGYMVVK